MSTPPNNTQGLTDQAQPAAGASPSPADIDKMVASYLQKKGYKATEAIFARESKGDAVSLEDVGEGANKKDSTTAEHSDVSLTNTMAEATADSEKRTIGETTSGDPDSYHVSYKSLRQWIENSLDWYKVNSLSCLKYYSYVLFIARVTVCLVSYICSFIS